MCLQNNICPKQEVLFFPFLFFASGETCLAFTEKSEQCDLFIIFFKPGGPETFFNRININTSEVFSPETDKKK